MYTHDQTEQVTSDIQYRFCNMSSILWIAWTIFHRYFVYISSMYFFIFGQNTFWIWTFWNNLTNIYIYSNYYQSVERRSFSMFAQTNFTLGVVTYWSYERPSKLKICVHELLELPTLRHLDTSSLGFKNQVTALCAVPAHVVFNHDLFVFSIINLSCYIPIER